MKQVKIEHILDDCIKILRTGGSVSMCLKKYPRTRGLKQLLQVTEQFNTVPRKEAQLDREHVWKMVADSIGEKAWSVAQNTTSVQRLFQFAVPKSVFSVIVVILIFSLINVTAVAAKNSVPGQPLHSVKKTVEKVELSLTLDDVKKTKVKIKHAEERLEETKVIAEQNPEKEKKVKALEKSVEELVSATSEVADDSAENKELLEKVVELTDKQESVLTDIETKLSGKNKEVVSGAKTEVVKTQTEAKENLAKLASEEEAANDAAAATVEQATSTKGIVDQKNGDQKNNETTSTTSDEILEALGDPSTTTLELIPKSLPTTKDTTTLEIINLR